MSLHYSGNNSYFFVNAKEIYKIETDNYFSTFSKFYRRISEKIESSKVSSERNAYDFPVVNNAINKSELLNIYKF